MEQLRAVVLTDFKGLNVGQMSQLRQRLREEKISYSVVKNTMIKLASKGTSLEKLEGYFEGPTAIAICYGDPVPLARILTEFQKTLPALGIKAGLIEGKIASSEEVKALASMPSREILFAQILGEIQTSGVQLAGTLLSAVQEVLSIIQARVDQLEQGTPASAP
jgi:large subunit ribosomal protein L10